VGRQREHIDTLRLDIQREIPGSLHGIRVEDRAVLVGNGRKFGDRVACADLVVRVDQADECYTVGRQVAQRRAQVIRFNTPVTVDRKYTQGYAHRLDQLLGCRADRGVLDGAGDQGERAVVDAGILSHAPQRQVVTFGAAAGEDDLVRVAVEPPGYRFAGLFDGLLGLAPEAMHRQRIAILFGEIGQHHLQHARVEGRCSAVVQIDASHGAPANFSDHDLGYLKRL